jgi:hypothetical protein
MTLQEHVIELSPTFDFEVLLQAAIDRKHEYGSVFGTSPLTTPESTPPPTRSTTPEPNPLPAKQGMATSNKRHAKESLPPADSDLDLNNPKQPESGKMKRRAKQRSERSHKRWKLLQSDEIDEVSATYSLEHHILPAVPIIMNFDISDSKVVSTGYLGLNVPAASLKVDPTKSTKLKVDPTKSKVDSINTDPTGSTARTVYPLEVLLEMDMILKKWDGRCGYNLLFLSLMLN